MRGWAVSPVIGAGTNTSPIRAQLQDREAAANGDRLEFIIGSRDRCLVAFDLADPSNLADHGGTILADLGEMDAAVSQLPAAKRRALEGIADEMGAGRAGKMRDVLRRTGRVLNPNFREDLHLGQSKAPPTGSFVSDTMTGTTGTTLISHTGETGATWAEHAISNTGEGVLTDANRVRSNSANNSNYYASGTPATNEYDVAADLYVVEAAAQYLGVWGRLNPTTHNGYRFLRFGTLWDLSKLVAGSYTSLGTYSQTLTASVTYAMLLGVRTATKKGYVDGVERVSSTDNVVTATDKAGIYFQGAHTNTTGLHLDNFTATDAVAAAAPPLFPRRPDRGLILR